MVAKKRRGGGGGDELDMFGAEEGDGVVEEEEEEVDDDIDIDTMIKVGTFTMCHLNFLTNKYFICSQHSMTLHFFFKHLFLASLKWVISISFCIHVSFEIKATRSLEPML